MSLVVAALVAVVGAQPEAPPCRGGAVFPLETVVLRPMLRLVVDRVSRQYAVLDSGLSPSFVLRRDENRTTGDGCTGSSEWSRTVSIDNNELRLIRMGREDRSMLEAGAEGAACVPDVTNCLRALGTLRNLSAALDHCGSQPLTANPGPLNESTPVRFAPSMAAAIRGGCSRPGRLLSRAVARSAGAVLGFSSWSSSIETRSDRNATARVLFEQWVARPAAISQRPLSSAARYLVLRTQPPSTSPGFDSTTDSQPAVLVGLPSGAFGPNGNASLAAIAAPSSSSSSSLGISSYDGSLQVVWGASAPIDRSLWLGWALPVFEATLCGRQVGPGDNAAFRQAVVSPESACLQLPVATLGLLQRVSPYIRCPAAGTLPPVSTNTSSEDDDDDHLSGDVDAYLPTPGGSQCLGSSRGRCPGDLASMCTVRLQRDPSAPTGWRLPTLPMLRFRLGQPGVTFRIPLSDLVLSPSDVESLANGTLPAGVDSLAPNDTGVSTVGWNVSLPANRRWMCIIPSPNFAESNALESTLAASVHLGALALARFTVVFDRDRWRVGLARVAELSPVANQDAPGDAACVGRIPHPSAATDFAVNTVDGSAPTPPQEFYWVETGYGTWSLALLIIALLTIIASVAITITSVRVDMALGVTMLDDLRAIASWSCWSADWWHAQLWLGRSRIERRTGVTSSADSERAGTAASPPLPDAGNEVGSSLDPAAARVVTLLTATDDNQAELRRRMRRDPVLRRILDAPEPEAAEMAVWAADSSDLPPRRRSADATAIPLGRLRALV